MVAQDDGIRAGSPMHPDDSGSDAPAPPARAMVLLDHQCPDGSRHYDWMIEPGARAPRLLTFRVDRRIDSPSCDRFDAERIADHRRAYLTYEGPISGGRGTVRRVAAGRAEIVRLDADRIEIRGSFDDGVEGVFRGVAGPGATWSFSRL